MNWGVEKHKGFVCIKSSLDGGGFTILVMDAGKSEEQTIAYAQQIADTLNFAFYNLNWLKYMDSECVDTKIKLHAFEIKELTLTSACEIASKELEVAIDSGNINLASIKEALTCLKEAISFVQDLNKHQ